MSGFRGHGQERGTPQQKGLFSQRELVPLMRTLIDTARSKSASKGRDEARRTLRGMLEVSNWRTPYVLRNIGARRCRYLSGMGYDVPAEYALQSNIENLKAWHETHG